MDSLAVSAIGLAAGGWQNVKLVGIYTSRTTSIPPWKLGICQITKHSEGATLLNAGSSGGFSTVAVLGEPTAVLVAPGTIINRIIGLENNSGSRLSFLKDEILFNNTSFVIDNPGWACAVLFTW